MSRRNAGLDTVVLHFQNAWVGDGKVEAKIIVCIVVSVTCHGVGIDCASDGDRGPARHCFVSTERRANELCGLGGALVEGGGGGGGGGGLPRLMVGHGGTGSLEMCGGGTCVEVGRRRGEGKRKRKMSCERNYFFLYPLYV